MATLTIRGVDDTVKERLRVRAARRGRSMEAEVRAILTESVTRPEPADGLASRIHARFAAIGGLESPTATRGTDAPEAAVFE